MDNDSRFRHIISLLSHRGFRILLISILFACADMPAMADQDLRPLEDDAGLFDPTRRPVEIGFQLFKDTDRLEIRVRDFRGQIVGNYHLVELRAGDHTFKWDGRDADGEQLPDGRYALLFKAEFADGTESNAVVDVRIASIAPPETVAVPEPLPPKEYRHKIQGSLSTFWRYNRDLDSARDSGEARLLTDFSFKEEKRRAQGVLSVLQPFYNNGSTSFNGSRALLEQDWGHGKVKGVFREGLGNFDDPMKLFSDFQSERKKVGAHLDYAAGEFSSRCLVFGTEGDVDSQEQGAAARLKLGAAKRWQFGASYTFREAKVAANEARSRNHALAADLRLPVTGELAMVMEMVHSSDTEKQDDDGYVASAVYDLGKFRVSGGYIDLGEQFVALFADPLHHISGDARGVEASVDYSMSAPFGGLQNPAVTLGLFDVKRYSDEQKIREMDASLRFGTGKKDSFFFSWFGQEEGSNSNHTIRGSAEHKWNAMWASRLQANHTFADFNRSWRLTLDTTCRRQTDSMRLALEWIQREIDTSRLAPFKETNLRFDWKDELWGLQLQARYSQNRDESGTNFFGRAEYKPVFFHRYRFLTYASVGNRAAFSFEEQVEIGMEVRY